MTESFRLEMWKQRLALGGFAGAFTLTLPLAAAAAKAFGHPLRQALDSALFFWVYVGLPLAACVLGASAGAGLRRTYELEAPLPVSPAERAWTALGAAAAQLLLLCALAALSVAALSTAPEQAVSGGIGGQFMRGSILLLAYALLQGLGACFVLAFLSGHGVAGGLAGGVLGACSYAGLGAGLMISGVLGLETAFLPKALAAGALTLAGTAWALGAAARWRDRERRGWGTPAAAAAAMSAGVLLSAGLAVSTFKSAVEGLYPFEVQGAALGSAPPRFAPEARKEVFRGLLLTSRRGNVVRVLPDGTTQELFSGDEHSLLDLVKGPLWTRPVHCLWDDDGTLWLLVHGDPRQGRWYEVWHGPARGPLTLAFQAPRDVVPTHLVRGAKKLGLGVFDHDGGRGLLPLPKEGEGFAMKGGRAAVEAAGGKPDLEEVLRSGASFLRKDGRKELFSLGRGLQGGLAYLQGEQTYLFVPERGAGRFKLQELPDGAFAGWRERWRALRLERGGPALLVDASPALRELAGPGWESSPAPRFARWTKESVWLILGNRLAKVDAGSGTLQASWLLPALPRLEARQFLSLDGVFAYDGRDVHVVGWDGAARKLSPR